jgi:hypothetical protein
LNLIVAQYRFRKDWWGHTVEIKQPEFVVTDFGTTDEPPSIAEVITWATENAQARRISYDTWQFRSRAEANQFIMLYKLTWT